VNHIALRAVTTALETVKRKFEISPTECNNSEQMFGARCHLADRDAGTSLGACHLREFNRTNQVDSFHA